MASSALKHWTASPTKEGCHWQAGGENRQTWQLANPVWYPQPTIATTDIQEAVVARFAASWHNSRWRHNWKSAQVVNCHVTPQSGNRVLTSFGNSGLCWTVLARNRDTVVPAEGSGDLQTLICVLVMRPRRYVTLSIPVPWMAAYLGYTLWMKTEDAVLWLTSYGSWHAYEKTKWTVAVIFWGHVKFIVGMIS